MIIQIFQNLNFVIKICEFQNFSVFFVIPFRVMKIIYLKSLKVLTFIQLNVLLEYITKITYDILYCTRHLLIIMLLNI